MASLNLPDIVDDFDEWSIPAPIDRRSTPPHPIVLLWILRILSGLDNRLEMESERMSLAGLFVAAGLRRWEDYHREKKVAKRGISIEVRLANLLAGSEREMPSPPDELQKNVKRVADLVGLSEVDQQILVFTVLFHSEVLLKQAGQLLGDSLGTPQVFEILAALLDLPITDVRDALSPKNVLARSGLVRLDRAESYNLSGKLEILSDEFASEMRTSDMLVPNLLRGVVVQASAPTLSLTDYEHVATAVRLLKIYLTESLACGRSGVNILVYGAPGTGKSELAKLMGKELETEIFEIAYENDDGDPINSEKRLRAIGAVQFFFAKQRAMIVFDEIEDVFNDGSMIGGPKSTAQTRKGWVNRSLENNGLPTFWLSNSVDCLDPAFIRRFDMVLEMRVPPRRQRHQIIQSVCGKMLDARSVARMAESEQLAPAVIARAASVVTTIQNQLKEEESSGFIELLVNQTLQAQGHPKLRTPRAHAASEFYDAALTCADANLVEVARGILQSRSGRLCLYGPPGTGKTAYGQWLADQLQIPLHVKRASDLLSMFVGGTEQNMAEAFARAREDGAVLLVDEVDSFLQDRRGAKHSWESTLVNEMLTQMEAFQGVLIASTNLIETIDLAAFRRFDIKVKFGYLKADQAWALFEHYCEILKLGAPSSALKKPLGCLDVLTPGDYALMGRQHQFRALNGPAALLIGLQEECQMKSPRRSSMGFLAG